MFVSFACNDRNGQSTGIASAVNIGEAHLECTLVPGGVRFEVRDNRHRRADYKLGYTARVGRLLMPSGPEKIWVGNMRWNGVHVRRFDAWRILNYLIKSEYWTCDGGPELIWKAFSERKPITQQEFLEAVGLG